MSTRAERLLAGQAIVARVVAEEVDATVKTLRTALEQRIAPNEKLAAELPDGTTIGTVGRSKPPRRPAVTDPAAVLAWVEANRPDEIVRSVNPAFIRWLESQARAHGVAIDPTTGEIIPGVEMVTGNPSYQPSATDEGRAVVLARLDELIRGGVLTLPAGASP